MSRLVCVAIATAALGGCAAVGPAQIANGRAVYADVIARTGNEQTLSTIVRSRYLESAAMLTVTSVTANVRLRANTGAQFGVGPSENYLGNLVPFSAGLAYEENPTISYLPVQGERFVRQFLSPVSVNTVMLLATAVDTSFAFNVFVGRMNGLDNAPVAMVDSGAGVSPFGRAVELLTEFHDLGYANWATLTDEQGNQSYSLVIYDYTPEFADDVRELAELLDLPAREGEGKRKDNDVVLPVRVAVGSYHGRGINIVTRSVYEVMQFAAAAVDVPDEHREIANPVHLKRVHVPPNFIRIHSSRRRPDNAAVAVPYRGWWFYIDETDGVSKRNFLLVQTLINMSLYESAPPAAPVLTIPVGGG